LGIEIDRVSFTAADHAGFSARLEDNLAVLGELLSQPSFGQGEGSLGAELEVYVVDERGRPLYLNQELQSASNDPQLTLELNRYNLEYNLSPRLLRDQAFAATENEIVSKLSHLRELAARHGGRILPIGILPTLRETDFGPHCITDKRRYHALVSQLIERRGGDFSIDINGDNPLRLEMQDITLEGANTSFQVHYRVDPAEFADTYNAIQLVTPLVLALAANSPMLFGHSLWHETRIPLFKQSIDTRMTDRYHWREPARVNFGQGWVRRDALELFTEVVRIYPPLLPLCANQAAADELAQGNVPALAELRLHQSTVWLWNRPVYDDADGGMLRIEMRALPAGPTPVDMVANAALVIGLAEGLKGQINALLPALPFGMAEYNFYRAAQHGLDARLVWPSLEQAGYRESAITDIIADLLPLAAQGLTQIGVDTAESARYLGVIEQRLQRRQTGAIWQQNRFRALCDTQTKDQALHQLVEDYYRYSLQNLPVADWPL
tara:strand:- start:57412 stop:58893 length:1482 start_codon:yes stop_codon:yes gene_type:complete